MVVVSQMRNKITFWDPDIATKILSFQHSLCRFIPLSIWNRKNVKQLVSQILEYFQTMGSLKQFKDTWGLLLLQSTFSASSVAETGWCNKENTLNWCWHEKIKIIHFNPPLVGNSTCIQLHFVHACRSWEAFSGYFQYWFPQELQFHVMRSKYIYFRIYYKMSYQDTIPLCLIAHAVHTAPLVLCHYQLQELRESTYNNQINQDCTGFE